MRTTYLTSLTTAFNPFSSSSHVPRLFLQLLPAKAHRDIKISQSVLPRNSPQPAKLELGFKDGKKMTFSWAEQARTMTATGEHQKSEKQVQLAEIVEEVERHARVLGRKEELSGLTTVGRRRSKRTTNTSYLHPARYASTFYGRLVDLNGFESGDMNDEHYWQSVSIDRHLDVPEQGRSCMVRHMLRQQIDPRMSRVYSETFSLPV